MNEGDAELEERRHLGVQLQRDIPMPSRPLAWVPPLFKGRADGTGIGAGLLRTFVYFGPLGLLAGIPAALLARHLRRQAGGQTRDWSALFFGRRSFDEKQNLLAKFDGQEVIIFGFSMLKGVAGTLDAAPPVSGYVRVRKKDGSLESIFVGDIWQVLTATGELIAQW